MTAENTSVTAQLGSNPTQSSNTCKFPACDLALLQCSFCKHTSQHSGQKIADIEILQQKLEFAEWEWNRATEGMKERDAKIALLESLVEIQRAALNQFIAACETAPPTSLMIEIGMACKVAKAAVSSTERADG